MSIMVCYGIFWSGQLLVLLDYHIRVIFTECPVVVDRKTLNYSRQFNAVNETLCHLNDYKFPDKGPFSLEAVV